MEPNTGMSSQSLEKREAVVIHEVSGAGMMGKIFWSSLLNKSASFILILGPTVQDCSYWREKEWPFSRKDGPAIMPPVKATPHTGRGSLPRAYMGGVSISHGRPWGCGGWAGMLFC